MSFLSVAPDVLGQAAGDLESIGSMLGVANAAAAVPTTAVAPPAADEISLVVAELLGTHAQDYQVLSRQAAEFHNQFVNLLNTSGGSYASAEAANAQRALLGNTAIGSSAAADQSVAPTVRANPAPTAVEYAILLGIIIYAVQYAISQIPSYVQQQLQNLEYTLQSLASSL